MTGMDCGWALVHTPDTGDILFLVERYRVCTAEAAEDLMNEAWPIAADWENAEMEQAVRNGHDNRTPDGRRRPNF